MIIRISVSHEDGRPHLSGIRFSAEPSSNRHDSVRVLSAALSVSSVRLISTVRLVAFPTTVSVCRHARCDRTTSALVSRFAAILQAPDLCFASDARAVTFPRLLMTSPLADWLHNVARAAGNRVAIAVVVCMVPHHLAGCAV